MQRAVYMGAAVLVFVFAFALATVAWSDETSSCVKREQVYIHVSGLG